MLDQVKLRKVKLDYIKIVYVKPDNIKKGESINLNEVLILLVNLHYAGSY